MGAIVALSAAIIFESCETPKLLRFEDVVNPIESNELDDICIVNYRTKRRRLSDDGILI